MGKLKLQLNSSQDLQDLLQETYKLADEQIIQAQNEINKMASATQLQNEAMDAKAKYGKIINDYLGIKDKAISKKLDIAKIMSDVLHYNGNVQQALDEGTNIKNMDFNFDDIKKMIDNNMQESTKTNTIQMKKDFKE
jgi:hypothetical protein